MKSAAATQSSGLRNRNPVSRVIPDRIMPKEFPMDHENAKGAPDKAKGANKDAGKQAQKGKFDKPLGSSHNDEADLRDVAREAAKKSQ
jgi:hypothetical protein